MISPTEKPAPSPPESVLEPYTVKSRVEFCIALVLLLMTYGLLFMGALVTSFGVGMAVPDGATTFGQTLWLYDWWDKSFGIKLEHTHRLAGMNVGLVTLALYLWSFFTDRRQYARWLATAALGLVIVQGLLGQFRVVMNATFGTQLAAVHGSVAQMFLTLAVTLVIINSRFWHHVRPVKLANADRLRFWSFSLPVLVYLQIVIGAVFRHLAVGFWVHVAIAQVVLIATFLLAISLHHEKSLRPATGGWVIGLGVSLFIQLLLGVIAAVATGLQPRQADVMPTNFRAFSTAIHLIVGSIFFTCTIASALLVGRLVPAEKRGTA